MHQAPGNVAGGLPPQARPPGPGARSRALEPYANNSRTQDSGPGTEPPSQRGRAWNPRPIYTLSPDASQALGFGDPTSEATSHADATARGFWTEVADYYDFRTRPRAALGDEGASTLGGRKRADRLRYCNRRRPALAVVDGADVVGIGHQGCSDRVCPSCQAEKSREDGELLRSWWERRQEMRGDDGGDPFLFVTLTDRKADRDVAGLDDVLAQLLASWRSCTNSKDRRRYRQWTRFVSGGLRVVEVTYSAKGDKNRDGSVVKYSGWHPHLHVLIELQTPPAGQSWDSWRAAFERFLRSSWYEHTRAAGPSGQHFAAVDRNRVGQLTKYCVKPFAVTEDNREIARECMEVLSSRRLTAGFGLWKGWRSEAEQLRVKTTRDRPQIYLASRFLESLWQIEHHQGVEHQLVSMVSPDKLTCRTRSWAQLRAAIEGDPRTIYAKLADVTGADAERQEAIERIALMQQTQQTQRRQAAQARPATPRAAASAIPPEAPRPSVVSAAG